MHKKFTRNFSTLKLPPKDLKLKRSRFETSLYLKQRLKFELSTLITSAIVSDPRVNLTFKPKSDHNESLQDRGRMTDTKLPPTHRELCFSHLFPIHNYSMTLARKGGFCDLKQTAG